MPDSVKEVVEEELNKLSFLDNHSAEFRCVCVCVYRKSTRVNDCPAYRA